MIVFRFLVLAVASIIVTATTVDVLAHSLGDVVPGGFIASFVHIMGDPDHLLAALLLAAFGFLSHRIFRYGRKSRAARRF